ncbi:MAG: hypothetical protein VB137_14780 [Burkholderia sp.]
MLVEILDRMPVQVQLVGYILDRAFPTAAANVPREPLRVVRVAGKEAQPLALHPVVALTSNVSHLELQVDAQVAARQIACTRLLAIVARTYSVASSAGCVFERRTSAMTGATRSPNTPWISSRGRNLSKRYASDRRFRLREVAIAEIMPAFSQHPNLANPLPHSLAGIFMTKFTHTLLRSPIFLCPFLFIESFL